MIQTKLGTRSTIFTTSFSEWNLNLHVIEAENYTYIIDTGLGSENMDEVLQYLRSSNKPIRVVNTHHHYDHVWGNYLLRDFPIYSSKECHDILKTQWASDYAQFAEYKQGSVEEYLPTVFVEDELYFEEDGIYLFQSIGHTRDGISVYDEVDHILNVGDNVGDSIDDLIPELEISLEEYLEVVSKYLSLDFRYCVSGHNQVLERSDIENLKRLVEEEIKCN